MVGEIRPEFPEREFPLDAFGFAAAVALFDAVLSLMTREELTGLVTFAFSADDGCSAGDALPFEMP